MKESKPQLPLRSREDWHSRLRLRFLEVARRRVDAESVEDVVQEALRVVAEKGDLEIGGFGPGERPALAWCFQVLRHTIGNHYQRERTRRARQTGDAIIERLADSSPPPLEALESSEAVRSILDALDDLDRVSRRCARYLRTLAAGTAVGSLASEEKVKQSILYRRIYRCRRKLRLLLRERGVEA